MAVLFYLPPDVTGPAALIVRPHDGPTDHSDYRLDREGQFFTAEAARWPMRTVGGSTG